MGMLILSDERKLRLQRFRRRTWAMVALCLVARGSDSALGLNLIEHTGTVGAQEAPVCPLSKEPMT